MKRWGLLLLLLLLLVVGMIVWLRPVNEIELTPAELVENVVEAYRGVEIFQYEMSMTMDTVTNIAGVRTEMAMTSTGSGVIDLLNERMQMTMTTQDKEGTPGMVMVMYFIDDMIYMKMSMPGMPVFWTKMEMPWGVSPPPIEQSVQLLKASEIELQGTEVVRGIDTFVVALAPDMEKLLEIMEQQAGVDPQMMEKITVAEDMFRDVTIIQWICKDTFLPVRDHTKMTMVVSEEFEMTMNMDMTNYYHSYNEAVSIVLPPEAAYAVEMPMPRR